MGSLSLFIMETMGSAQCGPIYSFFPYILFLFGCYSKKKNPFSFLSGGALVSPGSGDGRGRQQRLRGPSSRSVDPILLCLVSDRIVGP